MRWIERLCGASGGLSIVVVLVFCFPRFSRSRMYWVHWPKWSSTRRAILILPNKKWSWIVLGLGFWPTLLNSVTAPLLCKLIMCCWSGGLLQMLIWVVWRRSRSLQHPLFSPWQMCHALLSQKFKPIQRCCLPWLPSVLRGGLGLWLHQLWWFAAGRSPTFCRPGDLLLGSILNDNHVFLQALPESVKEHRHQSICNGLRVRGPQRTTLESCPFAGLWQ